MIYLSWQLLNFLHSLSKVVKEETALLFGGLSGQISTSIHTLPPEILNKVIKTFAILLKPIDICSTSQILTLLGWSDLGKAMLVCKKWLEVNLIIIITLVKISFILTIRLVTVDGLSSLFIWMVKRSSASVASRGCQSLIKSSNMTVLHAGLPCARGFA